MQRIVSDNILIGGGDFVILEETSGICYFKRIAISSG